MVEDYESYEKNDLWPILIETVHELTMYQYHKRYIKNVLLQRHPNKKPEEISIDLNIPLGEALVIYHELKSEKN